LEPRIIKLVPYNLPETPRIQGQQQHPGILQTCREARTEAERYYTKCLQKRNYAGSGLPRNIVYINFNVDRFHHGAYEIYAGASLDAGAGYRVRQLDDFNFKRSEILRIQRLDVELYRTYFPNGLTLARHLQPFWEHRGLEECTMKTKRYQDLQGESLGEELERNHCIEEFREIMKVHLEEQGKELNFQVKFVFRFWGNKIDLAPAPPRLPPSSES
jgi:hypothetical protein